MPSLTLTKHHGLGNDFCVLIDLDGVHAELDAAGLARAVCDRHRGIGADGLIVARPPRQTEAHAVMELRNADGSRAEMSGNGIRCLAQALFDAGVVDGDVAVIETDAGRREVTRIDGSRPGYMRLSVDMGPARILGEEPRRCVGGVERAVYVDLGNPHLVLLDPGLADADIASLGEQINDKDVFPDGINVEWIWPGPGPDELTLRVWERGVGVTEACGTGSCAAAAAAHAWGRVGSRVVVHNPGGDVSVDLDATTVLTGPAAYIATVEWPCR